LAAAERNLERPEQEQHMQIVAEYRRRATEVEQLAATAAHEDQRQRILEIAHTWTNLADQREKMIREGRLPPASGNEDG
jgi:hypothetical protein